MYASLRVQQRKNASTFSSVGNAASWLCSRAEKKRREMASKSESGRRRSISTPISRPRVKPKQSDSAGMGNVEGDIAASEDWPQRRLFFFRVGEAQTVWIRSQIAGQDCSQPSSCGNKALTVGRKMKAGCTRQLVGRKHLLPTQFVSADGLQIDPPEVDFVFRQRERGLDLEAWVGDVHRLAHVSGEEPCGGLADGRVSPVSAIPDSLVRRGQLVRGRACCQRGGLGQSSCWA